MNTKQAERLIPCHLPDQSLADSRVQKAVRVAERDEQLKTRLAAQLAFDERVRTAVEQITLPERLAEKVGDLEGDKRPPFLQSVITNPPVLAAVISVIVVLALLGRGLWQRAENFAGKETAIQLVDAAQEMSGVELEPINPTPLGKLNDWFAMNGMDRFDVPAAYADLKVIGGRVFKHSGFPVAQAAIEEHGMLAYVFRAKDLGIDLGGGERWRILQDDDWTAAIRPVDDLAFMLAFRGSRAEMQRFLSERK